MQLPSHPHTYKKIPLFAILPKWSDSDQKSPGHITYFIMPPIVLVCFCCSNSLSLSIYFLLWHPVFVSAADWFSSYTFDRAPLKSKIQKYSPTSALPTFYLRSILRQVNKQPLDRLGIYSLGFLSKFQLQLFNYGRGKSFSSSCHIKLSRFRALGKGSVWKKWAEAIFYLLRR